MPLESLVLHETGSRKPSVLLISVVISSERFGVDYMILVFDDRMFRRPRFLASARLVENPNTC